MARLSVTYFSLSHGQGSSGITRGSLRQDATAKSGIISKHFKRVFMIFIIIQNSKFKIQDSKFKIHIQNSSFSINTIENEKRVGATENKFSIPVVFLNT